MTLPLRTATAAFIAGLVALMALVALTAPRPASAQAPAACQGMHATDPDGDGEYDPGFPGDAGPAPANLEALGAYLNLTGGALTANIVIKNLDKTTYESDIGGSGGNHYYSYYSWGDAARFVRVSVKGGEVTYGYGQVTGQGVYLTDGTTTGTFTEGANGVASIVIPESVGGKAGETLGGFVARSETIEGYDDFFGFNHAVDDIGPTAADPTAPNGRDYTVTACPAGAGTGGGGSTGGGTGTPAPGTTPTPQQPGTPAATQPGAQSTTLRWRPLSYALGSAKKAGKRKKVTFKAIAEDEIKNLVLKLKKGSKTMGSAKSGTFPAGKAKDVKMSVSKKLKKGKYKLLATGFVGGKKLSVALEVTFS